MTNEDTMMKILIDLVNVLAAYENKNDVFSNQGQALDGYSALANFLYIANRTKDILDD